MNKFFSLEQIDEIRKYVDKDITSNIRTGRVERFASFNKYDLISFEWYNKEKQKDDTSQILIYFDKENMLVICENKKKMSSINQIDIEAPTSQRSLYLFFVGLIKNDMEHLENLEEQITQTEDDLLTTSNMECASKIIEYRKKLLKLKRYYEQLNSIFEGLKDNENNLITDDNIKHFKILDNRIDRLFSTVLNLRDYVTQVREAYQARIDIEQNNLMKVFTVITSVFLPLSLIASWYGMNLIMPETRWRYGYLVVIALSISVCIGCVIFFKKKKWF